MTVKNIECQIATVLMKRFLDGDNLPQGLLDDLERHLRACPSCQTILNNEHASIEEVLDGPAEPKGVASWMSRLNPAAAGAGGPANTMVHPGFGAYATPAPAPGLSALKNPKVLFLSLALALVLIAMSTLLRNPTNLLGPRASGLAAQTYSEPKESTEEAKPEDEHSSGSDHAEGSTKEPAAETEGHSEETVETHAAETTPGTDSHGIPDQKGPENLTPDPRVPGKPTLDHSDLIIAGGSSQSAVKKSEPAPQPKASSSSKHTSASTQKPAAKKPATAVRRSPAPRRKPAATPSPKTQSKSGSGIKVYDSQGKPIH